MTFLNFSPELTPAGEVDQVLRQHGFAVLGADAVTALTDTSIERLMNLHSFWGDLPADEFLKDGGHYRKRRHSCFVVQRGVLTQQPHRAHWQSLDYNALHGGMERLFAPMSPELLVQPEWTALLVWLSKVCDELKGDRPWFVEAHQFRIDTTDGIGRPTPEGAHRDGVDLVAVFMIERGQIKGGETRVFDAVGPRGQRFTLSQPWSVLLLDDARVIHESTPIQPADSLVSSAHRDTLVLTFRGEGFQGEL